MLRERILKLRNKYVKKMELLKLKDGLATIEIQEHLDYWNFSKELEEALKEDKCNGCVYDDGCIMQDNLGSTNRPYREGCEEYSKEEDLKDE